MKLSEQLHDINNMIGTTKKLLEENVNDPMLLYMLHQDEKLYSSMISDAFSKLLPNLKNAQELIEYVYNEEHIALIDPFYIANKLNIEVVRNPFLKDGIGRCDFYENKIVITYKPVHQYRDKFTIAHELGHIFLHFSRGIKIQFVDYESIDDGLEIANNTNYLPLVSAARLSSNVNDEDLEIEANHFAGELLVPKFLLDKLVKRLPHGKAINASLLKNFFQVSNDVIRISLREYGLLNSGKILDDINIKNRGW